jgi:glycosyltransferase involved in cell wall biosynthesis
MKIAVISMIREPWGGSEALWADMAAEALKQHDNVIHSTFDFQQTPPQEKLLIQAGLQHTTRRGFIRPGTSREKRILQKMINYFLDSLQNPFHAIVKFQPDYILYNGTCYSIANEKYLLEVLKKTGIPFGIIGHYNREDGKDISDQQAKEIGDIYKKAKNIFFVSFRSLMNARKRTGSDIPNATVVRNPVNMLSTEIVPYPVTAKIHFALVGNLRIIHKGQDIVLNILGQQEWKERDWHLNIYGSGEDEKFLRNLVSALQLQERVSFHGKVEDIRQLWADNHILLMPSLMEGMPLAVVEAMLCGRPCVATDVGGHAEWIEEGKQGWIAPNPARFGEALEKAWNEKANWEQAGKMAHEKALQLYDPNPGKTLLNIIKNTLTDGPLSKDH